MISCGVEISIPGGVVAMVRGPISWSLFFSFFFFLFFGNHARFVLRYKEPHAALAMARKKPINNRPDPLYLFMGNIKHPESIGNVPPA